MRTLLAALAGCLLLATPAQAIVNGSPRCV
jgi:hypothetical protein